MFFLSISLNGNVIDDVLNWKKYVNVLENSVFFLQNLDVVLNRDTENVWSLYFLFFLVPVPLQ